MSSAVLNNVSNQLQQDASKSAKKKAKAKGGATSPLPPSKDESGLNTPREHGDDINGQGEKEHIREVQKQIRNVNKKLNSTAKLDAILKENPNVALDELVATRKINNDQKAQALKKPALHAQLAQLEETLATFKRLDAEYEKQLATEKAEWAAGHEAELASARAQLRAELKKQRDIDIKLKLLHFSRFLAAAANRRNRGEDSSDEGRAFEGALLLVYGGDSAAVDAALKIVDAVEDSVTAVDGAELPVTFAQVKALVDADFPDASEELFGAGREGAGSDPTITHAGLTELNDPLTAKLVNGAAVAADDAPSAPASASTIDPSAANAAAETNWDSSKLDDPLSESFEVIPRQSETVSSDDNDGATTPVAAAATAQSQSWADEAAESAEASLAQSGVTEGSDGFQEVAHRHKEPARGGRGGYRGGERGGRGRPRGDGRGRGGDRGRGGRGRGRPRGD